jgi:hypothetical protein
MVGHDRISAQFIMTQQHAAPQGCDHQGRNGLLRQIHRPTTCLIQIPIHPDESRPRRELSGRRIQGLWETAVKMPGYEKPLPFWIAVRETTTGFWHVD